MSAVTAKLCPHCRQRLPLDRFALRGRYPGERASWCRKCSSGAEADAYRKGRRKKGPHERTIKLHMLGLANLKMGSLAEQPTTFESAEDLANYLVELWITQEGSCFYTGRAMTRIGGRGRQPTNASVDRIDPTKGYERGNLVLCQLAVNLMKSDLTQQDFIALCKDVMDHHLA